ncbi:glycosyltransferase family 4 protein [Nocardioides allogilvus]|uniref:glycosyltransferase family 4 protein n=1 Tax=Nocardioides allogilvus TaxID=2072017 RepID=UPI000D2FF8F6|nr:glycosyltransferase family 4 protein [Nocardioides allogilvus]
MTTPLKVWLVNHYAIPESAPGITRHATLARLMEERSDVQTLIISGRGHYWNVAEARDDNSERFSSVPVDVAPANGIRRVLNMLHFALRVVTKALRTPRGQRPDVVLASSPHLFGGVGGWLAARWFRVPFVLEVRDLWPMSLVELLGLKGWHPLVVVMKVLERFLYRVADVVFLVLPGSETHVRAVAGREVRTVTVPNGVDVSTLPEPGAPLSLAGGPISVVYAGAHGVPNALDTMIDAWSIIERRTDAPPMTLRLIGDGKEKPNLQALVAERGLTTVSFEDPVTKSEVRERMRDADILIITWRDSPLYANGISPNKLYDYMAAARPVVIAVNTPINPVAESDGGVSVPPEDPAALVEGLIDLADASPEERARLGRQGMDYVFEHHDLAKVADRLAGELRAAVERGRR